MTELTTNELQFLEEFGFQENLFQELRARFMSGKLSREHNTVQGRVEPPQPGDTEALPKRGGARWKRLYERGMAEIRSGRLALGILNGGMATRFGGVVKGIVPVMDGADISFLELKIRDSRSLAQECGSRIPIVIMNSWATGSATREHLEARDYFNLPPEDYFLFNQYLFPRLLPDGSIFRDAERQASYYGPGHGDFPIALRDSGGLEWLSRRGVEHLLVANVDNLGARVDPAVLGFYLEKGASTCVELAPKWPGDRGGCPARLDGKLQVVEEFRFPPDFDQDRIKVFNCNTFTFRVDSLDRQFPLTWFCVHKSVGGQQVIQFERLIGQLTAFQDCSYLVIPRKGPGNRFAPVKTPGDLPQARQVARLLFPHLLPASTGSAEAGPGQSSR